jgi:hypothetical protein
MIQHVIAHIYYDVVVVGRRSTKQATTTGSSTYYYICDYVGKLKVVRSEDGARQAIKRDGSSLAEHRFMFQAEPYVCISTYSWLTTVDVPWST